MTHSEAYRKRISSKAWRDLRRRLIASADFRCALCATKVCDWSKLEIHHKTYDRLGRERDSDLEVLCKQCHEIRDADRSRDTASRAADALEYARLDGWASKVYGPNWCNGDVDAIEAAFDAWVDRKEQAEGWAP